MPLTRRSPGASTRAVISRDALADRDWKLAARTYSGEVFLLINGRCFEDQQAYYIGAIAHELTHLLVNRPARPDELRVGLVSSDGRRDRHRKRHAFPRDPTKPGLAQSHHRWPAAYKAVEQMTADDEQQTSLMPATSAPTPIRTWATCSSSFSERTTPTNHLAKMFNSASAGFSRRCPDDGSHSDAAFKEAFGIPLCRPRTSLFSTWRETEGIRSPL